MNYDLSCIKRYGAYPAKISVIALRKSNDFIHRYTRAKNFFISFVLSLEEKEMLVEYDGIAKRISTVPYIYLVTPGSIANTLIHSRRHELFFSYSAETLPFFNSLGLYEGPFNFSPEFNKKLQELKQLLHKLETPGTADRVDLLAIDLAYEAKLAAQFPGAANGQVLSVPDERIFNVAKYLETNYANPITIAKLIERQNMTSRTFNREWNKYFTLSPNQYLIMLRIEKAKRLLSESTLQISQIAEKCGFCDVMYFTRCFKNKAGVTPGAYRKYALKQ